jgi:hypothetical protein
MATETEKARKTILRSIRKARKQGRITHRTLFALKNALFPLTFLVRNCLALQREPWWVQGSARVRQNRLLRILEERGHIFLEVRRWILARQQLALEGSQASLALDKPSSDSGYCSHCGGCCEIASGFPDFPPGAEVPSRWLRIFGEGLGKGHRFCAFLWELEATGHSICAIHPWRSNPCRVFEEDECEYFMNDLAANPQFDAEAFSVACRRLSHLINRG